MDELEISGKRYLSTRRAAKDHKYTSDYVGQLIRGGKVIGKKVGRSWYVEETSLNAYLSGESVSATKAAVKEPVEEKPIEVVKPVPVVAEIKEIPTLQQVESRDSDQSVGEKVFEPVIVKSIPVEEHHIPIHTPQKEKPMGGLRYIVDDEPALPEIKKKTVTPVPKVAVAATVVEEEPVQEEYIEGEEVEVIPRKKIGAFAMASLVLVGLTTLGLTALVSTTLNSRIVVEEGQVASVGYTFQ